MTFFIPFLFLYSMKKQEEQKTERKFKGIWIPREIWERKDLSMMEIVTLAELDSFEGVNGCFASNKYLGELLKLSPSRVSQIVSKLSSLDLISVELVYRAHSKEVSKRIIKINKKLIYEVKETPKKSEE